jgi:hypothetical protein
MATITLEYNARNSMANKMIEIIMAMDNVFKVKDNAQTSNLNITKQAIEDVEKGNVITCDSYDDYLKQTAQYA